MKPTKAELEMRLLVRLSMLEKRAARALATALRFEAAGDNQMWLIYHTEWSALDDGVWALASALGIITEIPKRVEAQAA